MHASRVIGALLATTALLASPALTTAHAQLESTDPPVGAHLDVSPTEVTLTFDDELRPDGSSFTVSDAVGHEVGGGFLDLDVADRNVLRGEVTVTSPGVYSVAWTVIAADGHPSSGEFSFGYRADADDEHGDARDNGPEHAAPDTALAARGELSALTAIGALLLAGAGLLAMRRRLAHVRS